MKPALIRILKSIIITDIYLILVVIDNRVGSFELKMNLIKKLFCVFDNNLDLITLINHFISSQ